VASNANACWVKSALPIRATELTLAVDSRNAPAMKLYFRHGLKRVGSRSAMIRDLRSLRASPVDEVPPVAR